MEYCNWSEDSSFRRFLAERIKSGHIVMMPTDTVYGLVARADSKSAVRRVFEIKRRDKVKALLVLVSSFTMCEKYCRLSGKQRGALRRIWSESRPTTAILPHRGILPKDLTGAEEGLGVRLPKSDFLRKMIRAVGAPIIATSANVSGQPVVDARGAETAFKGGFKPDLIVRGGDNRKAASRLVRIDKDGALTIIRP